MILAGNGVIRQGAADALVTFAEVLRIPVANTFMAKGVMPFTNELSLGTIGLKARDLPWFAFERADVVICVGYDMVEYHPDMWNPNGDKTIIHIDALPAEVDEHYIVAVGALGDIPTSLRAHRAEGEAADRRTVQGGAPGDRRGPRRDSRDDAFPDQAAEDRLGPARGAGPGGHRDLGRRRAQDVDERACTAPSGRTPASSPTALRRWASACRARSRPSSPTRPQGGRRAPVTPGFMMNSQEIETALRMKTPFVVLIWNDSEYGLITWHQLRHFGRPSHIEFNNPDFVKYAESFGAKGYRVERTARPAADAEAGARRRHRGHRSTARSTTPRT